MLQGIQTEIGLPGGFRMSVDGDDTAFFAQLVEASDRTSIVHIGTIVFPLVVKSMAG